jgi:hypothetical protein
MKSFLIASCTKNPGRIAQRESVPFTRERSKVRSLARPPLVNELIPSEGAPKKLGQAHVANYSEIRRVSSASIRRLLVGDLMCCFIWASIFVCAFDHAGIAY